MRFGPNGRSWLQCTHAAANQEQGAPNIPALLQVLRWRTEQTWHLNPGPESVAIRTSSSEFASAQRAAPPVLLRSSQLALVRSGSEQRDRQYLASTVRTRIRVTRHVGAPELLVIICR